MKKIILISIFIFVFIILIIYSTIVEPNKLVIKNETLFLPHWNESLDGLKVAVVSDLHVGSSKVSLKRLESVVNLINSNNPDVILLLGDLDARAIAHSNISQNKISDVLAKLKAPSGVFSIMGNHDYEPAGVVENIIKLSKITLLQNESKLIKYNNHFVKIIGFKDLWHFDLVPEAVIGTKNANVPAIVLSHNPDIFADIPSDVSLTLSGHTHGGEVYIPILGAPMVPSRYGQRFRKGYIVENNKHLFVTGGVATLSPFRFLNPPEVVFLTLNSQTEETKIENTKVLAGVHSNYIPYFNKFLKWIKQFIY